MKNLVILTLGAVVLFGGMAQAKLVSFSTDEIFSWSYSGAVLTQAISTPAPVDVIMTAAAESAFTITSTTTNETDFIWTGYIVTLNPAESATFVTGTAGSTKFTTVLYPNPHRLEFWTGEVLQGKAVAFQFDISLPDGPPNTFTLTQNPVPEPATFALLGLGATVLVAGRRRKE